MQHEVDLSNKIAQEKDTHCIVEKCLVGWPKKFKTTLWVEYEFNKSQMKDIQKLIYKCTGVGHMSISFNRACAHPFWKQLRNNVVTKLMPTFLVNCL